MDIEIANVTETFDAAPAEAEQVVEVPAPKKRGPKPKQPVDASKPQTEQSLEASKLAADASVKSVDTVSKSSTEPKPTNVGTAKSKSIDSSTATDNVSESIVVHTPINIYRSPNMNTFMTTYSGALRCGKTVDNFITVNFKLPGMGDIMLGFVLASELLQKGSSNGRY